MKRPLNEGRRRATIVNRTGSSMRFLVDIRLEDLLQVKEEHEEICDYSLADLIESVLEIEFRNAIVQQFTVACPQCGGEELGHERPLYTGYDRDEVSIPFKCQICGTRFPRTAKIDYGVKNPVT